MEQPVSSRSVARCALQYVYLAAGVTAMLGLNIAAARAQQTPADARSRFSQRRSMSYRVSIASRPPKKALRSTSRRPEFNPPTSPASLSTHAFYVGVTIDSASRQFQARCTNDAKAAKKERAPTV
jgi:hypothetical protein